MALRTALTEMFGIDHPIVLAPMGSVAGGALAAAVSEGGGLGLIGAVRGDLAWLDRECELARVASKPWGIGFLTWESYTAGDIPQVVVGMASMGVGGAICSAIIWRLGNNLTPWRRLF